MNFKQPRLFSLAKRASGHGHRLHGYESYLLPMERMKFIKHNLYPLADFFEAYNP